MELFDVESVFGRGLKYFKLDVLGIITDWKLSRDYYIGGKPLRKWRIFPNLYSFYGVKLKDLIPFKGKILFLVTDVYVGDKKLNLEYQLGVYGAEFEHEPIRLKKSFPSWTPLSFKRKLLSQYYDVKLVMRVPVRSKHHILFITDSKWGLKYVESRVFYKRHPGKSKVVIRISRLAQPLTKYDTRIIEEKISQSQKPIYLKSI